MAEHRNAAGFLRITCVLLLYPVFNLGADPRFTVESARLIPQSYYVGDRVELRIVIRKNGNVDVSPPEELPRPAWGVLHDLRVISLENKSDIRLVFTPYQTGTQTFPPLKLGDIVLENQKIFVRSLVEEGHSGPVPPRGQVLLPATRLMIGLIVGGFIALPLIGTFLLLWMRPRLKGLIAFYREKLPYRRLQKALKSLKTQIAELDGRRFYIALGEQLKTYLSFRGGGNCLAYTTREMEDYLNKRLGTLEQKDRILEVLVFGDQVKFGGRRTRQEKRLKDLETVREITEALEKKEKVRVHL
jgi:hypothetical protein